MTAKKAKKANEVPPFASFAFAKGYEMNKMVRSSEGFLESPGSPSCAFDAEKKMKLLDFALDYVKMHEKAPSMASLADSVGIGIRTLEKHLERDAEFKSRFREVLWRADAILDDAMFKRAKEPGGFMDRMAWKRRFFPEFWDPARKISVERKDDEFKAVLERVIEIEAEIVPDLAGPEKH